MNWSALASTFGLIFVAELGDKTQLAVVAQTCKYRRPLPVFLGASAALMATTAMGVIGGQVLGQFVPEPVLRAAAALAFVAMAALVIRETFRAHTPPEEACGDDARPDCASPLAWNWKAFGSTLGLLFVTEMGDKTQLAVLGLARQSGRSWPVFLGGALALTAVTALGVVGGQGLSRLIPQRLLLATSAVSFAAIGALIGLGIL